MRRTWKRSTSAVRPTCGDLSQTTKQNRIDPRLPTYIVQFIIQYLLPKNTRPADSFAGAVKYFAPSSCLLASLRSAVQQQTRRSLSTSALNTHHVNKSSEQLQLSESPATYRRGRRVYSVSRPTRAQAAAPLSQCELI